MKTVIPKTKSKPQKPQPKTPNPYDPQIPYKEPQSGPKDINGNDIEKDLIENDPSKGFERDMETQKSDEDESNKFQTIEPQKDNHARREFEIGHLGNERSFRKMNIPEMRQVIVHRAILDLPSENFNVPRFHAYKKNR